jgi:hypothetical protein
MHECMLRSIYLSISIYLYLSIYLSLSISIYLSIYRCITPKNRGSCVRVCSLTSLGTRPRARVGRLAQRVLGRSAVSTNEKMGRSTSTTPRKVEEPPPTPSRSLFFCCCGSAVDDIAQEVQLQVRAARAPSPLELQHGYANEENEKRGMAAPKFGTFEVTDRIRTLRPLVCR